MADGLDLSELMRRTVQANTRFYKGWVDLSLEYFRHITEIFGGVPETASQVEDLGTGAGALVLEGEAGTAASGAFLVTNDLGRTIKCELIATDFRDSDGNAIPAKTTTFEPATFDLAPGEQRVVRATLPIDGKLTAGVAYSGAFAIKGLDGFSVPAVVRRQHRAEESPIDRMAAAAEGKGGRKPAGRKPAAKKAARRTPAKAPRKK